jgi:hypothetical protein
MALIVEDGTGKADAESYASVADTNTYLRNRGLDTIWEGLDTPVKEQALRRATDYMVGVYRERWGGYRKTGTQRLDWPRAWAPIPDVPVGYGSFSAYWPDTSVPAPVQEGTMLLARRIGEGVELAPDIDPEVANERVGPISVSYFQGGSRVTRFREVDNLLSSLLKPQNNGFSVPIGRS